MKHFIIILALLSGSLLASAQVDALVGADTLYVTIESGEIESVTYYRLNYVEVDGGQVSHIKSPLQEVAPFLITLGSEKSRWEDAIALLDSDIARLQAQKALFEAIRDEIGETITLLE